MRCSVRANHPNLVGTGPGAHRTWRAGGPPGAVRADLPPTPTYSDAVTRPVPTAAIAPLSLVAGFAVAQLSGVRSLGGAVLVLGAAWCAWRAWRPAGPLRVLVVVALGAACFVVSHVLARTALGAWPSVLLVALVLAGATWLLVDRRD